MRTCPRCGKSYEEDQAFCSRDGSMLTTSSGSAPHRHDAHLEPGTVVGQYNVRSVLGKGAMGVVYEAEHAKLRRRVALKVLRSEYAADPLLVRRFFTRRARRTRLDTRTSSRCSTSSTAATCART